MTIRNDFPVSQILWYKIGGTVKYLLECVSKKDIEEAVAFIKEKNITKYFIIGTGANLIFTDDYYDGAVIRIVSPARYPQYEKKQEIDYIASLGGTSLQAFAGVILDDVIRFAFDKNLVGLEWAGGLPGTVGAAIRGNVGAFGGEIKDVIQGSEVIDKETLQTKQLNTPDLLFSYRNSLVKQQRNLIVISSFFSLNIAEAEEIESARQTYRDNIEYREQHHPHEYPNTGSVFKNISAPEDVQKVLAVFPDMQESIATLWHGKVSVGYLNNRLGFSGFQIGQAQVSYQHKNFINNLGGAKAKDVVAVIDAIKKKYEETFGFMPEPEVEIVT